MKIFESSQIRSIDRYTIENEPVQSIDLMERAVYAIFEWIKGRSNPGTPFKVFAGPGNNGGDGLAVARMLHMERYPVEVFVLNLKPLSGDGKVNYDRLLQHTNVPVHFMNDRSDFPEIAGHEVIIDGLFGSGLARPLKGLPLECVQYLNATGAEILAVDIPSGLFGEDNSSNNPEGIVRATHTLSLQFPKLSFFFPENEIYVGTWQVIPIGLHPQAIRDTPTPYQTLQKDFIREQLRPRKKFSHKGTYGHGLLIAGSYGRMGAAIMAAFGAVRSGIGLITNHCPRNGLVAIQSYLPEAMTSLDDSDERLTTVPGLEPYSAVGIGPGIGIEKDTQAAFSTLINRVRVPLVIDADGLNILGENKAWLETLPANTVLTPHPREFERMAGEVNNGYERLMQQIEFSQKHGVTVVLKTAHTAVSAPDGTCYFNTSGNPGMATGGSGDVLTGMILALLAQQYPPTQAALVAVYVHGLAADLAIENGQSQESLIATDIVNHLGKAFTYLRTY